MVAWGIASMAMLFVHGSVSFYVLRLLGGVAEAGFFPGCILYLTYWFPNRVRGEILGFYYLGVPLALVVGGPLSGLLLDIPATSGLAGWQWMFLVEGFFAFAMGIIAFYFLDDRPAHARWLPGGRKTGAGRAMASEAGRRATGPAELLPMLRDPRVLRFVLMYGLIQMGVYAAVFYLPAQVSALMHAAGCGSGRGHRHPLDLRHRCQLLAAQMGRSPRYASPAWPRSRCLPPGSPDSRFPVAAR